VTSKALARRSSVGQNGPMASVKVTPFRFTDEELELLGVIQGHTGVRSRTEALRKVLRYYVEAEGLGATGQARDERAKDAKGKTATSASTGSAARSGGASGSAPKR
jgi:hypothetical protein